MQLTITEPSYKRYYNKQEVISEFNNNKDFYIQDVKFPYYNGLACNKTDIIKDDKLIDITTIKLYYNSQVNYVILEFYDPQRKKWRIKK
tara:strand:+ start:503 stop:769 length:267 start_codon:yes stop_codon:yes gene_type:complete